MTKGDRVLVFAAVAVALLAWGLFHVMPSSDSPEACVSIAGELVAVFDVKGPGMRQETIALPNGNATLEMGDGRIRMLPLPVEVCPNGICWKTGWISRSGQSIVCVPNLLTITLRSGVPEIDTVIR